MKKKLYLLLLLALSGVLCVVNAQKIYDFKDGTIITNGQSDDGTLTLSGSYGHKDNTYGLDMKKDSKISIAVDGNCTLLFLASKHSSLSLAGVGPAGESLGTHYTKTTTDLVDTYDYVYAGGAGTLEFTAVEYNGAGTDIYLPQITVVPAQLGNEVATAEKNIIYNFDFRDGSIVPTTIGGSSNITKGLVTINAGEQNAYEYNGADHGSVFKAGNQVVLQVAGNSYIKVGGCQYSGGTISASSTTGVFEQESFDAKTAACYHQDGTTIDFLYVGEAGTVTLDFSATTYVPYIQIVPVPFDVELAQWVQKSGTITVNGVEITLTSGATATDAATVTVSGGMVMSATAEEASIRINLGGNALADYTPTYTGDISGVSVSGDALIVTYADDTTKPNTYTINVADNSKTVVSEKGKTYTYNFADGSVLPQTAYTSLRYKTFISTDGILTINSNTDTEAVQFGYHDASHGAVLYPGNSMDFVVAGDATISFGTCQYSGSSDAIFTFTDASGEILGTVQAKSENTCGTHSFSYTGEAGVLTATLSSTEAPTGEFYFHNVSVANAAEIIKTAKTDVWDFGAAQLDEELYNNRLTINFINGLYPADSEKTGVSFPSGFTAGVLSWVGGGNDRLRTSNTNLIRYDANGSPADFDGETFTGSLYVNASAAANRYFGLTLAEDDEVAVYAKSQNGTGKLTFEYIGDNSQKDVADLASSLGVVKFVAKKGGSYHIYDAADKPFYYRVTRKDAAYATLSGSINTDAAPGIPANFSLVITNEAGKEFTQELTSESTNYSIQLPVGYSYTLGLGDANGYIISNGTAVTITDHLTKDIVIEQVITKTLSGSIEGLTGEQLEGVKLLFTPAEERIFVPTPVVNNENLTYTVAIEPGLAYTISATGINDYSITNNTVNISADATHNITFALKPTHKINITASGLNAEQTSKLNITFANLNEPGYTYSFTDLNNISLRDGVYSIVCTGLDEYPLQLRATSNLTVNGAETSKTLAFAAVKNWSFNDAVITNGTTTAYKGMLFTGTAYNEIAKGHLVIKDEATVRVPLNPGEKLIITYYYSAKFTVDEGEAVETASGSTSQYENVQYVYTGTEAGYMTIKNVTGSTTYITDVTTAKVVAYAETITVGADKEYQTINDALAAVRAMDRPNTERVKIMVDPGNYEEMLIIDIDSVSIINASANPSIALQNQGVDIDENAVRITSYYGHGYNYYSMGTDQKWNADVLRVNKENGYNTYSNTGSGTGNGSYWNATVVVSGKGFEASHIIFENSFNQYISQKESEDVVVEWASGGKGTRPTDKGNTAVQNKSFVERAAAIAYLASGDKSILYKCRIIGRQDSFYGAEGARVVAYKGSLMGGTDYLFGGMTLVAYKSDLAMNTSEVNTDVSYITAAQQNSARGYLLYECTVTSAQPETETASQYLSKPGYFGRPWQANTGEAVFYNTRIKATNNPNNVGKSMIIPVAWLSTLGGESAKSYEYGTIEESGEDNSASRASWSQVLSTPKLSDGTDITTFNFTKGNDNWDPIPALVQQDNETFVSDLKESAFNLLQVGNRIMISGISSDTTVSVYGIDGSLISGFSINADTQFELNKGFWIVKASNPEGKAVLKAMIP